MKVFGCGAFVHIPKDEMSKLDCKTKQHIFLGYEFEEFGYKLWDPFNKNIIRSKDGVFFENNTIEDIKKDENLGSAPKIPVNLNLVPQPVNYDEYEETNIEQDNVLEEPLAQLP